MLARHPALWNALEGLQSRVEAYKSFLTCPQTHVTLEDPGKHSLGFVWVQRLLGITKAVRFAPPLSKCPLTSLQFDFLDVWGGQREQAV